MKTVYPDKVCDTHKEWRRYIRLHSQLTRQCNQSADERAQEQKHQGRLVRQARWLAQHGEHYRRFKKP